MSSHRRRSRYSSLVCFVSKKHRTTSLRQTLPRRDSGCSRISRRSPTTPALFPFSSTRSTVRCPGPSHCFTLTHSFLPIEDNPGKVDILIRQGIPVGRGATIELRNMHATYAATWCALFLCSCLSCAFSPGFCRAGCLSLLPPPSCFGG